MRALGTLPLAVAVVAAVLTVGCGGGSSTPPFRIEAVIPAEGPSSGGTEIVLVGRGFRDGTTVTVGGASAPTVVYVSPVALTVVTPAGLPGVVDVIATHPNGREALAEQAFTYIPPPTIFSVNPTSGPTAGGTQVVITGTDFQAGAVVTLGGLPATVFSESPPTTIVITTPSGTAGVADLAITNPDGEGDTLPAAFTYIPPPQVIFITPRHGPSGGGTIVTINGIDFQPGVGSTTVAFDGVDATGVNVVTTTEIECTSPPGTPGVVDVVVTNPDGQTGTGVGAFEYTTAYSWYEMAPPSSPPPREHPRMAYDPSRGVTVLFGGFDAGVLGDTWEWNGMDWTDRQPAPSPPARTLHALAQDTFRNVTVLFGGGAASLLGDTWEWDGVDWTPITPATNPPARQNHAMVFDSVRDVVVLFGGFDGFPMDDTWEWDGTDWNLRGPVSSPLARLNHAMSFDEGRGVTVLFGGLSGPSYLGDTWEWDGTNWVQKFPTSSPPARDAHALAYDAGRGLIVLFGGYNSTVPVNDTWEWDGTIWLEATPGGPPAERLTHAMASDTTRGVVTLFGGFDGSQPLSDTWEFAP